MPTESKSEPSLEKVKCKIPPLCEDFKITMVSIVDASHICIEGDKCVTSPVATIAMLGCFAIAEILIECP